MTANLRTTTAALAVAFLALLALVHVVQSGVDPVTRPTSDYRGFLMLLATVAIGVAAVALAVLIRPLITGAAAQIGVGLLVFFGVAKVLQAVFSLAGGSRQVYNTLGDVTFFILPIAALCVAFALRSRVSIGLAVALAAALVLMLSGAGGFGLAERIYLVLGAGWLLVTALTARSSHPVTAS